MSPIPVSVALIWLLLLGSAFAETPEPSKSSVGTIEERPTGDRTEIQSRGGFRDPIGPYGATEAEGQQASSGDVQERGVPPQGFIVQGDQLRAAPGYLLEKGANNQMTAKRKAGGAVTNETVMTCGCTSGTGMCMVVSKDDVAICSKYPQGPCNGKCEWSSGPPSKGGPPRGR